MMQFFTITNINFIKYRMIAIGFSLAIILLSLAFLIAHKGPNMAIDFSGGTLVQIKFEKPVHPDLGKVRQIISGLDFGSPEVKTIGAIANNEIQITVKKKSEGTYVSDEIRRALETKYKENPFELRRQEQVGPKVGGELRMNSIIAVILSLVALLIYIGVRFNLPFGVAAIVPLFHDVTIALSAFFFLNMEISLSTLAALLTIAGYSLNDTIVIFDRIRENMRSGAMRNKSFEDLVNTSINQTLSRTIITFVAMLFVVVPLYALGGESIKDFSLAMLVGTVAGVYSTVYIASPILIWWNKRWAITK